MTADLLARVLERSALARVLAVAGLDAPLLQARGEALASMAFLSDLYRVHLEWGEARAGHPATMVLKVVHGAGRGRGEMLFYDRVAPSLASPSLATCHGTGTDAVSGLDWLLLEDLSRTHVVPSEPGLPPRPGDSERVVAALARVHAQAMRVQDWRAHAASGAERLRDVAWLQEHTDRMLHRLGELASERTRFLYRRFIDAVPALARRYDNPQGLTLVHGDAHVWNFMLPRAGTGHAKLLDWDAWVHGLGATDLAYMMALYWDREPHQRFRDRLLACYHRELEASGVTACTLGELQQDYRLAVLLHLRTPVTRYAYGIPTRIWWMQLMRVMQAVEDVGAEELLD